MRKLKIVHVVGSPVSQYYNGVSTHYCRQMVNSAQDELTQASFDFHYAVVLPGGAWCITTDLDEATIEHAPKLSTGEALTELAAANFDACVPHSALRREQPDSHPPQQCRAPHSLTFLCPTSVPSARSVLLAGIHDLSRAHGPARRASRRRLAREYGAHH